MPTVILFRFSSILCGRHHHSLFRRPVRFGFVPLYRPLSLSLSPTNANKRRPLLSSRASFRKVYRHFWTGAIHLLFQRLNIYLDETDKIPTRFRNKTILQKNQDEFNILHKPTIRIRVDEMSSLYFAHTTYILISKNLRSVMGLMVLNQR